MHPEKRCGGDGGAAGKARVKGFWNFSHYDLTAKFPGTVVENVHLGDSLMTLCYGLHALRETKDDSCEALD